MRITFSAFLTVSAICGGMSPALANMTNQDAWKAFQNYMSHNGFTVTATGTEEKNGTLSLSDVIAEMTLPDGTGTSQTTISSIIFTENDDGSVSSACPEPVAISSKSTFEDEVFTASYTIDCTQLETKITGSPENYTVTSRGPKITVSLSGFEAPNTEVQIDKIEMTATDMNLVNVHDLTEQYNVSQEFSAGTGQFVMSMTDPQTDSAFNKTLSTEALKFDGVLSLLDLQSDSQMSPQEVLLQSMFEGDFSYSNGKTAIQLREENSLTELQTELAEGAGKIMIKDGNISLNSRSDDVLLSVNSQEIPFPFEVSIKETAVDMNVPMVVRGGARNFAFGIGLKGAEIADVIWAFLDPNAHLPRDPLNLVLQLDGTALEETASGTFTQALHLNVASLNMKELLVQAAGAELTGTGTATMDNTGENGPGLVGKMNLMLTGGTALLEKLVAAKFVSQEQAMGAQMMMGLFAKQGSGQDELVSEFELLPDGQLLVNGQQIQ